MGKRKVFPKETEEAKKFSYTILENIESRWGNKFYTGQKFTVTAIDRP